jgi:predicted nucleotide-binding protein (sugar kinase/HSP70/actin superfamily)
MLTFAQQRIIDRVQKYINCGEKKQEAISETAHFLNISSRRVKEAIKGHTFGYDPLAEIDF